MDGLTTERRSWNMSRIKGSDTKIEVLVRSYLFGQGFRFRKNDKRLPGKPDVVLPKYKTAIFVNGCFWHMHSSCREGHIPKTNSAFWKEKLERNVRNDEKHYCQLKELGWQVIVLWECELEKDFETIMNTTIERIKSNDK